MSHYLVPKFPHLNLNHQLCHPYQIYRTFILSLWLISRSPSTTGQPARTQEIERNLETLKRKYNNIDNLYREAKGQNIILKTELERKTEHWREWHEWWNILRQTFKVKSPSPSKQPNHPPRTLEAVKEPQDGKAHKDTMDQGDVMLGRDDDEVMIEGDNIRTTFSPDVVATRRETQSIVSPVIPSIKPMTSIEQTKSSEQLPSSKPKGSKSNESVGNNNMEAICEILDIPQSTEVEHVQTTSKPSKVIENLDIPESPISNPCRTSLSKETPAISLEVSPRRKSAPTQRSRTSNSSTPLSTRTSGKKSKKRDYPSMKFYTEDGTDRINPRTPSPVEPDDGGQLMAILEGPPPEAPGIAMPISRPNRKPSPPTTTPDLKTNPTIKSGQVREVIEIESDSGSGEISTPIERTPKRQKVQSEARLPRQLLSPDLALKNKGRGRYSSSILQRYFLSYFVSNVRNPGDPPRLEDFVINPENNQGLSHAFNDVVRGKDARKSLDATSCPNCAKVSSLKYLNNWKFYPLHGDCDGACAGAILGNHRGDQHIQQVSKHRGVWPSEPVPPGFWNSNFPTEEQLAQDREEAERRKTERVRQIAEEAARGNGRWKRKYT